MTLKDPTLDLEWREGGHEFKIVEFINEGAYGRVYKAQMDSETCAIKFINPNKLYDNSNKDDIIRRFKREARVMASVEHENAIRIKFKGEHPHLGDYIIMEIVEGARSLEHVIQRTHYDGTTTQAWSQIITQGEKYLRQGLRVLNYLRGKDIIHRDLKPGNFLITPEGVVKLTDFGLGKETGQSSHQTQSGTSMGTPWYISPEQVNDSKKVTAQCDIYGLGATFFHVLTGRPLFQKETALMTLQAHYLEEPKWPREIDGTIDFPERLEDLLMSLVAKRPDERFTPEEALRWMDQHDPEPGSLEEDVLKIADIEEPLWRRVSAETFDQYAQLIADNDLLPVEEWKESEVSIAEPLTENTLKKIRQYEERYEKSQEEINKLFEGIETGLLSQLAELHESIGYRTNRYFPEFGNRYDHFLLAYTYMSQMSHDDTKHTLLIRKLASLERRRMRKFPQLFSKSSQPTMISRDPLKELPTTAPTMEISATAAPAKKPKRLLLTGIAALLAAAGTLGTGYFSISTKHSDLQNRITNAEQKIEKKEWDDMHAKIQEAENLEKSIHNSLFSFMTDTTPEKDKIKTLVYALEEYDKAVKEFKGIEGKLEQLKKTYEALSVKTSDKNKYFEAVEGIKQFQENSSALRTAAQKQEEWLPERVKSFNERIEKLIIGVPDLTRKIREYTNEDLKKAKENIQKAKSRFKDLEDITRQGVTDTAAIVNQQLINAEEAINRAKKTGIPLNIEEEYANTKELFSDKHQKILWYSKLVKDSEKDASKALELGKYHFEIKPYFNKKDAEISRKAFEKAGEQGKTYLKILELVEQVRDPKNQVTLVGGVSKSDVESFASQVNAYKQNPGRERRELAIKMLQPIASGLAIKISSIITENKQLNRLVRRKEKTEELKQMRAQFLANIQNKVKEARSYFEGTKPQVNPKIVQEFKDALDKAGYKGIVQRQYVRAAMPK